MIRQIFLKNMDIVFFVYGFAFVTMGIAIFVHPRIKDSIFKLAGIIWLLGLFGLIHGFSEWLDMFDIIKKNDSHLYYLIRLSVLTVSYTFFFEFARRLMSLSFKSLLLNKWVGGSLYCFLLLLIFLLKTKEPSIWPRYLLGFPAGLLTAFGFFYYYRNNEEVLGPIKVRKFFLVATFSLGIYGVLGGLITPKAEYFPATIINNESFFSLIKIPVQVFRAICAIFLSWSVWHILGIFNWEFIQREKEIVRAKVTAEAERKRAEEIEKVYSELEKSHLELKEAQNHLIHAAKMDIVGRLASGAAHEVKNPLAVLTQGMEYLKNNVHSENENIPLTIKYMEEATLRADDVIRGLLDFSALSELDIRPENLNLLIDKSLGFLKHQLEEHRVGLVIDFKQDLPLVQIDKSRIDQVLINLIFNAIEAMPDAGELKIKTYTEEAQDGQRWVVVQIEDTGTGIPENALGKIFDPFFTTKRDRGGTGLGLSVVRNIIDMHGGKIEIGNRRDSKGVKVLLMFRV
jgi:signal transduction histidine kinase